MTADKLPTISKEEVFPPGTNYADLLAMGMENIAKYSGEIWTNYNHSDPGITILQNLCYALTELGLKADLPIKDILTNETGNIDYEAHFDFAEDVLTSNPVLIRDFQKMLLNAFPVIKQVYFEEYQFNGIHWWLQPFVEVKPEFIDEIAFKDLKHQIELYLNKKETVSLANSLLNSHANIGQQFAEPAILISKEIRLGGIVYLDDQSELELALAKIIYSVNNYLSPYPIYQSYTELINSGEDVAVLLEGPFLKNGYLSNQIIGQKRHSVTVLEIANQIIATDGVTNVTGLYFIEKDGNESSLEIPSLVSILLTIEGLLGSASEVQMFQLGKPVTSYDEDKVKHHLNQLIPKPKPQDLGKLLPKGNYKKIKDYYSFQHQFPANYRLTNLNSDNSLRNAQALQLKGYLMVFDQLMANYLTQLADLPSLFTYKSGRNVYQVSSKTYYTQPVYQVPGASFLLKDAEVFKTTVRSTGDPNKNWELYQEDNFNPYFQQLNSGYISSEKNQKRKAVFLKHLLARFGSTHNKKSLSFTNPTYGKLESEEVDHISEMLLDFKNYSTNKTRGYFQLKTGDYLFSGFELLVDQEINLTSYIQGGIIELIRYELDQLSPSILVKANGEVIFGEDDSLALNEETNSKTNTTVTVVYDNEPIINLEIAKQIKVKNDSKEYIKSLLNPGLRLLEKLITAHKGFVMIDHNRLLKFLKISMLSKEVFSEEFTFDEITEITRLIVNGNTIVINAEVTGYTIQVRGFEKQLYSQIESKSLAKQIVQELQNLGLQIDNNVQLYACQNLNDRIPFEDMSNQGISIFLPRWVSLFESTSFQQYLFDVMLSVAPVYSQIEMALLNQYEMNLLLGQYGKWINAIKLVNQHQYTKISKSSLKKVEESAFEILKLITTK